MLESLSTLLETLEVTEPRACDGLQLFGLRHPNGTGPTYRTLDEALTAGVLDVTEVSEGGSVPVLRVVNKADPLVFLMAGEHLKGAKQNRVLNASVLVPGLAEVSLPVSCVEARRWHYQSPQFGADETLSHGQLRQMMCLHAHAGYRTTGSPTSCQSEVWAEVDRKLGAMGSASPTAALYQAYADHRQRLADMLRQLPVAEDCAGVAFAMHGRIAGADFFDRPATLARLWPKLVRSYALDCLEYRQASAQPVARETVLDWLHSSAKAHAEVFRSPGLGEDVRLEGPRVHGAGLVLEGHPVHVELFARDAGVKPSQPVQTTWTTVEPPPAPAAPPPVQKSKPTVLSWLRRLWQAGSE
jgi:hypothetical protein